MIVFLALALRIIDSFHIIVNNLTNSHSRDVVKVIGNFHAQFAGNIRETDINGFCSACIKALMKSLINEDFYQSSEIHHVLGGE